MIERIRFIQNPLTIIAIFAGLAEIAGTAALASVDKELQSIFIWFVMGFPLFLVCLFFITLNFNPTVLYAPSDFRDEQNFLHILANRRVLKERVEVITKQIENEYRKFSERFANEVQEVRNTDRKKLEDDLNDALSEIRKQLSSIQQSADAVVSEAGRQAFPKSKLQADILELLSSSKHEMTANQITDVLGMSENAINRALDRLCKRGLITRSGDAYHPNFELYG